MSPPSSPAVPIGPHPDYQVNCSTCGCELEWTVCQSNAKGNRGNTDGAGSLLLHDPDAGPAALPQQLQPPQTDRSGHHAAESEEIDELFSETEPVAPRRPGNSRMKVKHSITVYAWLEDGKAPRVFNFQASSTNSGRSNAVFIWLHFYLNYEVLSTLGLPAVLPSSSAVPQSGVELYNLVGCKWCGICQNHLVVLSEGDVILLKAAGVYNCFNIDYYINRAAGAISNSVPDIHSGLHVERESVQDAPHQAHLLPYGGMFGPMLKPARRGVMLSSSKREVDTCQGLMLSSSEQEVDALLASDNRKRKPTHSPHSQSSGDEPEIVSVTFAPPQPKVHHNQLESRLSRLSGKLSIPPRHRTHSHSLISDSSVHEPLPRPSHLRARQQWKITRSAFSHTPSPEPGPSCRPSLDRQLRHCTPSPQHQASVAPSSDVSAHPSESSHGDSPGGTSFNPINVNDVQVWLGDYYICDIVWGFERCEKAWRLQTGVPKEFVHLFGNQFMKTTFHMHKKCWYTALQHVQEQFISYGKMEKGLWQNFIEYMNKDTKSIM
ncbi:hypothetical protein BDN67DRAFT_1050825 [Paxillus ammoniavirescens]|nr:hypothetical protein BDN67DRAFT_1050825 [Paxillus ammoniavirescens]